MIMFSFFCLRASIALSLPLPVSMRFNVIKVKEKKEEREGKGEMMSFRQAAADALRMSDIWARAPVGH